MERLTKSCLEGLKVIDFTWLFVGPITCKFFGDLGATVLKLETQKRPDELRMMMPFKDGRPGFNRSGMFAANNSSKLGLVLNLYHPKGPDTFKRLIQWADVLVETHRPGTMKRWGLDYEDLVKVNAGLIMLSHTMQGQDGPFANQPTHGILIQAQQGFVNLLGWPDREPVCPSTAYPDFITPFFATSVLLGALDYRRRTGKGQYIDLAQFEVALHFLEPSLLDCSANGGVDGRMGNRTPHEAPHGAYRCRGDDRWCAITVSRDSEWRRLCAALGDPPWSRSKKFATMVGRKKNEDELEKLLEERTLDFAAEDLMLDLQRRGVPAGLVQNGQDLVERDPQLRARQHLRDLEHPEMGKYRCPAPPFRLSKTPVRIDRPFPSLGEHTEHICRQILGMSDQEFVALMQEGVFE